MNLQWISVKDQLPENGKHVLVHYTGGNWIDRDDQFGNECLVAKFERNITAKDRPNIKESMRGRFTRADEFGNNLRGFCWVYSGHSLFGQDVDFWSPLPSLPTPP